MMEQSNILNTDCITAISEKLQTEDIVISVHANANSYGIIMPISYILITLDQR